MLKLILISLLFIGLVDLTTAIQYAPTVSLQNGQVRGVVEDVYDGQHKVFHYNAIRYGRAARFEKPKPVEPWTGVYNATERKNACPQSGSHKWTQEVDGRFQSEDCLFLSIWMPETKKENRSVMFYIHGGGYSMGSIFLSDMGHVAAQGDVIFVSVNYRLGPLGFLTTGTHEGSNFGLHDPILALHWVRDNIRHFGGNPNDVTISGESAGSISVGALILSPLTKGLFHRAILQSGSPVEGVASDSMQSQLANTERLAQHFHCPTKPIVDAIKCMKAIPLADFINGQGGRFFPVFGDEVMPIQPSKALKDGHFNHVDVLYGVCRNEGSSFIGMAGNVKLDHMTVESAKQDIENVLKNRVSHSDLSEMVAFYMSKLSHSPTQDQLKVAVTDAMGDYIMVCPTILFAQQMAKLAPNQNYYSYRLMENGSPQMDWRGVGHGTDLIYLFDPNHFKGNVAALKLSHDMIRAWTNFVKAGKPGMMDSHLWEEAFQKGSTPVARYMSLESKYHMVDNYFHDRCDQIWKPRMFA